MTKPLSILSASLSLASLCASADTSEAPVRLAIVGLVHAHVDGFLPQVLRSREVELVGIVEEDQRLVKRCAEHYQVGTNLFAATLVDLLARTNVQAVATFTSTYDHLAVVESCAPRGVHVMVEKPLAVNLDHARAIESAARKGGIEVLVNYETTWYPANHAAYQMVVGQNAIGKVRKMVVHSGHSGPKEIGCPTEFLAWLTDPVRNGGGALTDFGCYGADLMTWLMQGRRPTAVFAVTRQFKPDVYPKVDDEATVVLTYPEAQGIIQASWNWPVSRKDMELYGETGQVLVPRRDLLEIQTTSGPIREVVPPALAASEANPLSYLAAVVRGHVKPAGLSSLELNMTVTEILDAARESALTGKRIDLPPSR